MQFMDSHIHLQDFNRKDISNIVNQAVELGITKLVCVSAKQSDWYLVAAYYEQFPNIIIPAFGLHPWYCSEASENWLSELENILHKYPRALIGEIGLDKVHNPDLEPQNTYFDMQLNLSKKYNRPVLIHAVRCADWLDMYWRKMPNKFVFHSFNSKLSLLKKVLDAGGYVSFSSSILRHPKKAEIISSVPKERLLWETDAPFQRISGNGEDMAELLQIAAQISLLQGETQEETSAQVYKNSLEFINVK